jgi:hypothetical protein
VAALFQPEVVTINIFNLFAGSNAKGLASEASNAKGRVTAQVFSTRICEWRGGDDRRRPPLQAS